MKHLSASQIKTYRDCARKWYFERTSNVERTVTPAIDRGKRIHTILENVLLAGAVDGLEDEPLLTKLEWLPALIAERGAVARDCIECEVRLEQFALPILGFIDLVLVHESGARIEIVDHKTTSDWKYALTVDDLAVDPQAIIYCYAMTLRYPDAQTFTFTHHVINTRRAQTERLCSVHFARHEVEAFADILSTELANMQATFTIGLANAVPGAYNDACHKYGGCPFREACGVAPQWGRRASANIGTGDFFTMLNQTSSQESVVSLTEIAKACTHTHARIVYRDCMPTLGELPVPWAAFVEPVAAEYRERKKVPSHLVVPYQEGVREVAIAIHKAVCDGALAWPEAGVFVDSGDPCAALFCTLLGAGWQIVRPVR